MRKIAEPIAPVHDYTRGIAVAQQVEFLGHVAGLELTHGIREPYLATLDRTILGHEFSHPLLDARQGCFVDALSAIKGEVTEEPGAERMFDGELGAGVYVAYGLG